MLKAVALAKHYPVVRGVRALFSTRADQVVRALDGVSFEISNGETFGIVGESGCGKSTLAKVLLGLEAPSTGRFEVDGEDGAAMLARDRRTFYRRIQMVFQDPYASLNPSHDVQRLIASPLLYQGRAGADGGEARVRSALERVSLRPADLFLRRHPHHLSGGQRQRLCIARALVLEPGNIVADEPVSMLDVSVKWDIIRLMKALVRENDLTLLYITHDLATVSSVCDRIAIMYLGRIVETGPAREILRRPLHPYTKALVAAVPGTRPDGARPPPAISGTVASAIDAPQGCRFRDRCPSAVPRCAEAQPELEVKGGREVACYVAEAA